MNPLLLALLSAAMWGVTDLVTSFVGRRIGSLRVVVIAVSTSLVLAGAVAIARGALTTIYDPAIVGGTLVLGVAAGIAYIGVFTAFRLGPLSVVSPTISAYGALAAFLAVIFLNERLTPPHIAGVIAVGIGISLLGLQTYFTAGVKEVRAWTIHIGDTAPQAAGVIHTDFERGFIRAQTIAYEDFIQFKGEQGSKEVGKMRAEGKEYIVKDGDVLNFLFNV